MCENAARDQENEREQAALERGQGQRHAGRGKSHDQGREYGVHERGKIALLHGGLDIPPRGAVQESPAIIEVVVENVPVHVVALDQRQDEARGEPERQTDKYWMHARARQPARRRMMGQGVRGQDHAI